MYSSIVLNKLKNYNGKTTFNLTDLEHKETIEVVEDELCSLLVDGKIVGFEKFKGISQSEILVEIMLSKKEHYIVAERFEAPLTSSTKIAGYTFKDNFNNEYILRLKDALKLVNSGLVSNAKINPDNNYICSKTGEDLRKINRSLPSAGKYLTEQELKRLCEILDEYNQ